MPGKRTIKDGAVWIASQQGKHFCHCGCGGEIKIRIHHHARGVPRFINHHAAKLPNHPLRNRTGEQNGRWKGGNYVKGSERAKSFQRQRYQENREAVNAYQRDYNKRPDRRIVNAEEQRRWRARNPERNQELQKMSRVRYRAKINQRMRDGRTRLRSAMLTAYGHICECCGETEADFLTLAHLNGDGAADRKQNGQYGVLKRLRDKGWPKDAGYALQCANCNWATRYGAICPHRRAIAEMVA